ncbi:MAG TPA: SDR family oxidoreductase [Ramlibacter sp.]|nr:SDR family oxidoreductase [Ramlibacter sp.]
MRVLITGATGFIGRAVAHALRARGHAVVAVSRHARGEGTLQADFAQVPQSGWWLPHLRSVDVVVNAVGILREQGGQTFQALHADAPAQLFHACKEAGVPLVVQISALGADAQAQSRYHLSKKAADDVLRSLPVHSVIVQPSVVYAPGGTSAALFNRMAAAPLLPLPQGGRMQVQPVHLDDVVQALVALVEAGPAAPGGTLVFSGPKPLSLRDYLAALRKALGFSGALRVMPMPEALFRLGARVAGWLPGSMLDAETAGMLLRGNAATEPAFAQLLGRAPRDVPAFIADDQVQPLRRQAALDLWLPVLRLSLALVWLWTAVVSLGLYPVQDSYALLAATGLRGAAATVALYGAAALDLLLGLLILLLPAGRRGWLWAAQLLLIGGYTLLITIFLPEYWLHPYGPLSKNLPMMAAIALLWSLEPTRRER